MRNEKDELGPCSESITTSATFSFGSLETAFTVGESLFFGDSRQVLLLAGNILVLLHLPLSQRRPTRLDKALYCIKLSIFFDRWLERVQWSVGQSYQSSVISYEWSEIDHDKWWGYLRVGVLLDVGTVLTPWQVMFFSVCLLELSRYLWEEATIKKKLK